MYVRLKQERKDFNIMEETQVYSAIGAIYILSTILVMALLFCNEEMRTQMGKQIVGMIIPINIAASANRAEITTG